MTDAPRATLRLDKWLWHARFFRTRTLASERVARGKVRVNGKITRKPAASVGVGDVLTFVQGREVRVVRVAGLPERRGPVTEAIKAYEDVGTE